MGLLLSDSTLIDALLDETLRLWDGLGAWAYAPDVASDPYAHEVADPVERPQPIVHARVRIVTPSAIQ
jgi:hypothetical protein